MPSQASWIYEQVEGQWKRVPYPSAGQDPPGDEADQAKQGLGPLRFKPDRGHILVLVPADFCNWQLVTVPSAASPESCQDILINRASHLKAGTGGWIYYRQLATGSHLSLYSLCHMRNPLSFQNRLKMRGCRLLPEDLYYSAGWPDGSGYYEGGGLGRWFAQVEGFGAIFLPMDQSDRISRAKETLQAFALLADDGLRATKGGGAQGEEALPGSALPLTPMTQRRLWIGLAALILVGSLSLGLLRWQANHLADQLAQPPIHEASQGASMEALAPFAGGLKEIYAAALPDIVVNQWQGEGQQLTLTGEGPSQDRLKTFCAKVESLGKVDQVRLLAAGEKDGRWHFQLIITFAP
ncbi:hypothetical protein ACLGL1_00930 [Peptococcus simiae]|uniref:hypothetical protein n=1 Tax=Peptococcus simiae TaxID=1643805 RepID=UPI003980B60B